MGYQSFKRDYEQSGLTQKAYSQKRGISASMVCYYLRKAREEVQENFQSTEVFSKIDFSRSTSEGIKIILPSGIQIEIPI